MKKRKPKIVYRPFKSSEIRDLNEIIKMCNCWCHTDPHRDDNILFNSHSHDCCSCLVKYESKLTIGLETTLTEVQVNNHINKQLLYFKIQDKE